MGFVVLPASISEIRAIYDVYFAAFDKELVTKILFPWDIHDNDFRKGHADHTLEYWKKDTLQHTFKCIDTDTGLIVGMSLWDFHWKERTEDERKLPLVDWLEGQQKDRAQRFIRAFWERKEQLVGGRKHVYCHVVAVHPKYQRKGIGNQLTQPGIEVADQLSVPIYLEATDQAIKMYHNNGFEKLDHGVVLGTEVTGDSQTLEAPIMIRMPNVNDNAQRMSVREWISPAANSDTNGI